MTPASAADDMNNRMEQALAWITKRAAEGHGAVQIGYIEDGNLGVWIGTEEGCRGIGDDALSVIESAIHGEALIAKRLAIGHAGKQSEGRDDS